MNKILIIDDNKYIRFAVTEMLSEYGFTAVSASTCKEGFQKLESENPNLVIIDKKLPDGDGIDIIRMIRQSETHSNIPIIMLTAYANELSAMEALKLGVSAFFTKPFDNEEIVGTIKKILG